MILDDDDNVMLQESIGNGSHIKIGSCKKDTFCFFPQSITSPNIEYDGTFCSFNISLRGFSFFIWEL